MQFDNGDDDDDDDDGDQGHEILLGDMISYPYSGPYYNQMEGWKLPETSLAFI